MVLDLRKLPDSKSQMLSPMFPSGTVRLHVFHLYSRSIFSSFLHSVQLWSKHTFFARGCPALVSSLPHRKEVFLFLIKMPPAWLDRVPLCGQPYPDWSVLLDSESPHTRRQGTELLFAGVLHARHALGVGLGLQGPRLPSSGPGSPRRVRLTVSS